METSEKVVLREQPEIKDLLQTLMKQGLKKEQRRRQKEKKELDFSKLAKNWNIRQ